MKTFKQFLEQKLYNEMDADLPKDTPQHIANPTPQVKTVTGNFGSMGSYVPKTGYHLDQKYRSSYNKTYQIGPEVYKKMKEHEKDIKSFLKEAGAEDNAAIESIAKDIVQDLVRENPSGDYLNKIPSFKSHQEVKAKGILQIDSPYESLNRSIESIKDLYLTKHPERNRTWDQIDGDMMLNTTLNYLKDTGK